MIGADGRGTEWIGCRGRQVNGPGWKGKAVVEASGVYGPGKVGMGGAWKGLAVADR